MTLRLTTRDLVWQCGHELLQRLDNLSLHAGEHLVISGPNGSGKSRLLEVLAGYRKPSEGTLDLHGARVSVVRERPDEQLLFRQVVRELLFPLENLRLPRDDMERRLHTVARQFHLERMLNQDPFTLSGGQKQLLLLAVAAIAEPDIYLIDQPFEYLDTSAAELYQNWLITERDRGALLITSTCESTGVLGNTRTLCLEPEVTAPLTATTVSHETADTRIDYHLENLVCGYPEHPPLIKPLSLHISPGENVRISGPMGSGKTTLALTMAGLIPPKSGTIRVNGKTLACPQDFFFEQGISYAFQYPEKQLSLDTARDEINVYDDTVLLQRVEHLLPALGFTHDQLDEPLNDQPDSRRRLWALLLILALQRPLCILDEPFAGLDREHRQRLLGLLHQLSHSLVIIDHTGEVEQLPLNQNIQLPDHTA